MFGFSNSSLPRRLKISQKFCAKINECNFFLNKAKPPKNVTNNKQTGASLALNKILDNYRLCSATFTVTYPETSLWYTLGNICSCAGLFTISGDCIIISLFCFLDIFPKNLLNKTG